ncbi:MAG: 50S ribosomal protein L11 methyltransferase [Bacteroidales bacterium]|nr:50S ribosomal protein L11 methyltransferase [Bacteroidales bacterium]
MEYCEIKLTITPTVPFAEIIMAELGDAGYDSFVETDSGLLAYIPKNQYDEEKLKAVLRSVEGCQATYELATIPDQDWNAAWEKEHQPVMVDNFCWIYAPFHQPNPNAEYNILIEPKMSFGTAHHPTTYMMLQLLNSEPLAGKRVLDMGSGTGVLSIFAEKRGAAYVEAIDNDEWAYRNALENLENNNCRNIKALLGDAALLTPDKRFDVVVANINRNILLRDMHCYTAVLAPGGTLLLSGFYEHDIPAIRAKAEASGLAFDHYESRQDWVAVKFRFRN